MGTLEILIRLLELIDVKIVPRELEREAQEEIKREAPISSLALIEAVQEQGREVLALQRVLSGAARKYKKMKRLQTNTPEWIARDSLSKLGLPIFKALFLLVLESEESSQRLLNFNLFLSSQVHLPDPHVSGAVCRLLREAFKNTRTTSLGPQPELGMHDDSFEEENLVTERSDSFAITDLTRWVSVVDTISHDG